MLKILFDSEDVSIQQSRFEFVSSQFSFDGVKEITIGYYKPINALFLNVLNQAINKRLSVKYFNGTSYVALDGLKDLSFGLATAGFVTWDRNQTDEKVQSGLFLYKIQLTELDGSPLTPVPLDVTFKGINLVFSDDFDLVEEYPSILQHLPDGQETFIRFHAATRDEILTDLKNSGIVISGGNNSKHDRKQLDQWDLLDKDEVKEASKYATLSKIFNWLSDREDDKYHQLASQYQAEAGSSLTPLISIDMDDDGIKDQDEEVQTEVVIVGRL